MKLFCHPGGKGSATQVADLYPPGWQTSIYLGVTPIFYPFFIGNLLPDVNVVNAVNAKLHKSF